MKKTYINPTLTVVKVQPARILAGSPGLTGTYSGGTVLGREAEFSDWEIDD
jgi:hypothetical protein